MQYIDRAGNLHRIEGLEGVNVWGGKDSLVAVTVEAVVGVSIAGHIITAASTVAIIVHWAILSIGGVPA
jgi:hypothetical protein